MNWFEITIYTTEEALEMVSYFYNEMGAGGVSIEESDVNKKRDTSLGQWYELPLNTIPEGKAIVKGYFPDSENVDELKATLSNRVEELKQIGIDPGEARIEVKTVHEEDWANAWKQYFKPLAITDRITVKPTWEPYEAREDELIIELDPGMAFGTGTHATTALCLRALDQVIQAGDDVIDVGTGSGILAIGAVKLGAGHVLALDLDPVAVSSARENTALNQLADRISIQKSDLLTAIRDQAGDIGVRLPVQVVVANLLADIILMFVDEAYEALASGGYFITSGIIVEKEQKVLDALQAAQFTIIDQKYEEGWVAITARR